MRRKKKTLNAKIKKELQSEGIIPPDKPRLNRKKFVEEAMAEWNDKDKDFYAWELYLYQAISVMLGSVDRQLRVTPEAIGVRRKNAIYNQRTV